MTNVTFLILVLVFWAVFYGMLDSHAQNEWKNYGRKSSGNGKLALFCSVVFVLLIGAALQGIGIL